MCLNQKFPFPSHLSKSDKMINPLQRELPPRQLDNSPARQKGQGVTPQGSAPSPFTYPHIVHRPAQGPSTAGPAGPAPACTGTVPARCHFELVFCSPDCRGRRNRQQKPFFLLSHPQTISLREEPDLETLAKLLAVKMSFCNEDYLANIFIIVTSIVSKHPFL